MYSVLYALLDRMHHAAVACIDSSSKSYHCHLYDYVNPHSSIFVGVFTHLLIDTKDMHSMLCHIYVILNLIVVGYDYMLYKPPTWLCISYAFHQISGK